jgi:hypothetical protein
MLIRSKRSWAASIVTQQVEPSEELSGSLPTSSARLPSLDRIRRSSTMPSAVPIAAGELSVRPPVSLCRYPDVFRCGMRCGVPHRHPRKFPSVS